MWPEHAVRPELSLKKSICRGSNGRVSCVIFRVPDCEGPHWCCCCGLYEHGRRVDLDSRLNALCAWSLLVEYINVCRPANKGVEGRRCERRGGVNEGCLENSSCTRSQISATDWEYCKVHCKQIVLVVFQCSVWNFFDPCAWELNCWALNRGVEDSVVHWTCGGESALLCHPICCLVDQDPATTRSLCVWGLSGILLACKAEI